MTLAIVAEIILLHKITFGRLAISVISSGAADEHDLGVTSTTSRVLRLAAAIGGGSILVKYLQKNNYVRSLLNEMVRSTLLASDVNDGLPFTHVQWDPCKL